MLSKSFYEARITMTPKPNNDRTQKRKYQGNIPNEHKWNNSQENIS